MFKKNLKPCEQNDRQRTIALVHREHSEYGRVNVCVIDVGSIDASATGVNVHHGFSSEPRDCLFLVRFGGHVLIRLWEGELSNKNLCI